MIEKLEQCTLCPHKCKVNRLKGELGRCRASNIVKLALVSLHKYEEPCISGTNGSGTIFFSNCNLKCMYCQNYEISQQGLGKEVTIQELSDLFLLQQQRGAHNINLVTPTIYAYHIIEALDIAKSKGLSIPIIYNSNGYENIETLELLKGYIDVYLPDFKYYENNIAKKYSGIENYYEYTTKAIKEMERQVGGVTLDKQGIIQKGLIIRHLILPNNVENTKQILNWIDKNIDKSAYVSIMAQYFPAYLAKQNESINRKLTKYEYKQVENYLYELDLDNGYIQDLGEHEEEYVPLFNNNKNIVQ